MKRINQKLITIALGTLILSNNLAIAAGKKKPNLNPSPSPSPSAAPSPSPLPSPGPNGHTCNDVIKACDEALKAKDTEIKAANDLIDQNKKNQETLLKQVNADDNKLKNPLRNPFLMAGAGAGIGLIVGGPIAMGVGILGGIIWILVVK